MTDVQFEVLKVLRAGGKIDSRVWSSFNMGENHWLTARNGKRRRLKTLTIDSLQDKGWILTGRRGHRWGSVYRSNRKISSKGKKAFLEERKRRSRCSRRS